MRRRWLLASTIALGLACSNLEGLSGGGADAGSDAGPDASSADAPADALAGDAADAAPFSCNDYPDATFCTDFGAPAPETGFDDKAVDDGGALARDDKEFVSPPAALRASLPQHDAGQLFASLAKKVFRSGGTLKRLHIEMDVRIDRVPAGNEYFTILYVCQDRPPNGCGGAGGVTLKLDRTGLSLQEETFTDAGHGYADHSLSLPTASFGAWMHIAFDLDATKTAGGMAFSLDGVSKLPANEQGHAADYALNPWVNIGLYFTYPSAPVDIYFDNFVFEAE
jgi:hypothetical protein